jgi:hypothetical protein
MYVIINKDGLSETPNSEILGDILWYNMPSFLRHWLSIQKGSALSLLDEIHDEDPELADFLEKSINKSLWIPS